MRPMRMVAEFLADIDTFLARSGMSATAFGKVAVGDPNFVNDVRTGRAPSLRLVERVYEFIRSHDEGRPNEDGGAEADPASAEAAE